MRKKLSSVIATMTSVILLVCGCSSIGRGQDNSVGSVPVSYTHLIYEKNWKKSITCSLVICFVLLLSDIAGVVLSTATIRPVLRYANIVLKSGLFLRCIVMFALVQFIKQWKALKDGEYVPWGYWVCILLVLCSSVYFIISWVGTVPDLRFVWLSLIHI